MCIVEKDSEVQIKRKVLLTVFTSPKYISPRRRKNMVVTLLRLTIGNEFNSISLHSYTYLAKDN